MNGAARPCITRRQGPTRPDWTPFSPLAPNRTHENAEGKTPWDLAQETDRLKGHGRLLASERRAHLDRLR